MTDPRIEAAARAYHEARNFTLWEHMHDEARQLTRTAMAAALSAADAVARRPPAVAHGEAPDTSESAPGRLTGAHVKYYLCNVPAPVRTSLLPYTGECDDFILNLRMTFQEGCVFKAIWRSAAARLGWGKPGHSALYDAEKIVHYGRLIEKSVREALSENKQ